MMFRTPGGERVTPSIVEITALVIGGWLVLRYAWLMDDAYVYFRYVDNLVIGGKGLVWNGGEFVEGFTSPFWALLLAGLRGFRADYWVAVRAAGVAAFAVFWWLAVLVNRGLATERGRRTLALNLPLLYLSVCYGALCYFTSGLESPLVLVMAALFACAVLWPDSTTLQVSLGVAPLVRPELAVPYVLALIFIRLRTKRTPVPAILSGLFLTGGYLAFRVWYYADLFPNTFHLKDEAWVSQGFVYLWDLFSSYWALPFLALLAALYVVVRRRLGSRGSRQTARLAMLLLAAPVAAYTVRVGGAPIHFKDLAFPFVLVILAGGGLVESIIAERTRAVRVVTLVVTALVVLAVAFSHPRQLRRPPILRPLGFGHSIVEHISDAAFHRAPKMGLIPGRGGGVGMLSYDAAESRYLGRGEESRVLVEDWCRTAYMHPRAFVVHSLGLTEPFLARMPVEAERPAHKFGLEEPAGELAEVRRRYGFQPGAFSEALEDGRGQDWMQRNLGSIESIEARAYNRHRFVPNLLKAFSSPEVIRLRESEIGRTD